MKFGPEFVKKLIDQANAVLADHTVDQKVKAAVWECLKNVQEDKKTGELPGSQAGQKQ